MPNMSYCRMENTHNDLQDVYVHLNDPCDELELIFRHKIIELCHLIIKEAEELEARNDDEDDDEDDD